VSILGIERGHTLIGRAHDDKAVADQRRRDHVARHARLPQQLAVGRVTEHLAALTGNRDHETIRPDARSQRRWRPHAPHFLAVARIEPDQSAFRGGRIDRILHNRRLKEGAPAVADPDAPGDADR